MTPLTRVLNNPRTQSKNIPQKSVIGGSGGSLIGDFLKTKTGDYINKIKELHTKKTDNKLPWYLGQFDTNYIIFRNVKIFRNYFFQIKNIVKENSGIFKNNECFKIN